jgi:hypothetical protein
MDDLPKYEESSPDELQTSLQREGR